MVWSIFEYENPFVTTVKVEINGIPCLKFKPKDAEGLLPTVINYHGWHSSKDFKKFEAITIASHGYQVIVPDALHHGDRNPIDYDDPTSLIKYLWKIIFQSINESKSLIEHIINEHDADPDRIAIMGDSMGAITAGGIFVDNPSIKCIIGFNGTFSWEEAIKRNCLPPLRNENKELIERFDPMNNIDTIKGRPILILNGIDDNIFPIDIQRLFYNQMLPYYNENKNSLELVEASNVNHRTTTGMLEKAIIWLKEHL